MVRRNSRGSEDCEDVQANRLGASAVRQEDLAGIGRPVLPGDFTLRCDLHESTARTGCDERAAVRDTMDAGDEARPKVLGRRLAPDTLGRPKWTIAGQFIVPV
jgi:hypothetical protein